MKKRQIVVMIAVIGSMIGCMSRKVENSASVSAINEGSIIPANTITYTLPKTVLRVEVETERTACKMGPFFNYSERYLNITNVVREDKEFWQIKSVRMYPVGIADNSRKFAITSKGDAAAQYISLSEQGTLLGINVTQANKTEAVTQNVAAAEIEAEKITFDSVPLLEKHLKATSSAMMAEGVANTIYKLRKRQLKLLGFEYEHHPCEAPIMKYTLEELKKQELVFTEMFVGKCIKQTIVRTFDLIPDSMGVTSGVLFRFSSELGALAKADVSGSPIYYQYSVTNKMAAQKEEQSVKKKKAQPSEGLYYCVPAQINIKVTNQKKLLLEQSFGVAQLGTLIALPAELISKPNVVIELEPNTGALRRIGRRAE